MQWPLHARCIFLAAALRFATLVSAETHAADKAAVKDCRCWAVQGQCQDNPRFMNKQCPASCAWHRERETSAEKISNLTSARQQLEAELETVRAAELAATSTHQVEAEQLKVELESVRASEVAAVDKSRELEAQIANLRSEASKQAAFVIAQGAANKSLPLESPVAQLNTSLGKQPILSGCTLWPGAIESTCSAKAEGEQAQLAAELQVARAANEAMQKEISELKKAQPPPSSATSDAVTSSTPREAELEADLKRLRRLLDSVTAAELASTNESHILEARVLELESVLQSKLSTESLSESNDTDPWIQAYEVLVDLPGQTRRYLNDLPGRCVEFSRSVLEDFVNATTDAIPLIRDDLMERAVAAQHFSRIALAAATYKVQEVQETVAGWPRKSQLWAQEVQETVAGWPRKAQLWARQDSPHVDNLQNLIKQALSAEPYVVMVVFFCLLPLAAGICFLSCRSLRRRSRRVVAARVAPPLGQEVASSGQPQHGPADTSGSVDALAASRLRRRELQEQRTLQALKLVGVNPTVNECTSMAASAPQDGPIVTPKIPFRERWRPTPLLDLDIDSDVDVVKDRPGAPTKPNVRNIDMYADEPLPSFPICLTLAIFVALAIGMTVSLLTLLACLGYLDGGELLARLSASIAACSQYVMGVMVACSESVASVAVAAGSEGSRVADLVGEYAVAMWVACSQSVTSVAAAAASEASKVADLVGEYAVAMWGSLNKAAADAGDVICQVAAMLEGHVPILAFSAMALIAVAVAVRCECRRRAMKKCRRAKLPSCKKCKRAKLQDPRVKKQSEDELQDASVKTQPEENEQKFATLLESPAQEEQHDMSVKSTTTGGSSGEDEPLSEHQDQQELSTKDSEEIEQKFGTPAQEAHVAEICPVFDMSAEDEDDQDVIVQEPTNSRSGCFNMLFFTRFLCVSYLLILAGLSCLHLFGSQLEQCRQSIESMSATALAYTNASGAVLQDTISVHKVKIAWEAFLYSFFGTKANAAENASLQFQALVEAAGASAYLTQVSILWEDFSVAAGKVFLDTCAEPYGTALLACVSIALVLCLLKRSRCRTNLSKIWSGCDITGCAGDVPIDDGSNIGNVAGMVAKSPVGAAVVMGLVSQRMFTAAPKPEDSGMFTADSFMI